MNAPSDLELRLESHFVNEAPARAPDRVLASVVRYVQTTPQQRRAVRVPWRYSTMPGTLKLAFGAALLALALISGGLLLTPRGANVGSSPSPSAATATPRPPCTNPGFGGACLGRMDAGTYTTASFTVPITYTVPAGWDNQEDEIGSLLLLPPGETLAGVDAGTSNYLGVYWDVYPLLADCATADPSVGRSSKDLASWLAAVAWRQGDRAYADHVGSLPGYSIDVTIDPAWTRSECQAGPSVGLISGDGNISGFQHGIGPGLAYRYYFLDAPGHAGQCLTGTTCPLAIEVAYTPRTQTFADYDAQVQPIIDSLGFSFRPEGAPATLPPDGTYRAIVTTDDLAAAGYSPNSAANNSGTLDLTLSGGSLALHYGGTHEPYDCTASQAAQGDQVVVTWQTGCGGAIAYQWTDAGNGIQLSTPDFPWIYGALYDRTWTRIPAASPTP